MKKQTLFDILFIVITALVFSLITYLGHSRLISQFAVIFALISYFTGKYIGQMNRKS